MLSKIHHIKFSFLICLILCLGNMQQASAQLGQYDTIKVYAFVYEGDTIPGSVLPDVTVFGRMPKKWKDYWADWTRLRNAVYITYPYAKAAGKIMNEINAKLVHVKDNAEKRRIIKSREKELKKEFADKLTKLSVYQGKVLMKLINRETGNSCYHIIKEYKGGFSAVFWQTIAVVFGSNLKQSYNAQTNDREMEKIVQDVERMYGHRS